MSVPADVVALRMTYSMKIAQRARRDNDCYKLSSLIYVSTCRNMLGASILAWMNEEHSSSVSKIFEIR